MIMRLSFLPLKSYTEIIKKFKSLQNVERSWSSTASSNFFEIREYFSMGISWAFQCNPSLKFQHNLQTLRTYSVFSKGRPGDRRSSSLSKTFFYKTWQAVARQYIGTSCQLVGRANVLACPANSLAVRSMTTLHHNAYWVWLRHFWFFFFHSTLSNLVHPLLKIQQFCRFLFLLLDLSNLQIEPP